MELAADSTAAPTLGREASSCPGLLREEVVISFTTEPSSSSG
ncbi:MAG: hypothetical protein Q8K32_18120 [Archangium sp.]|nr:hypothetical protein [Archangium sp.]